MIQNQLSLDYINRLDIIIKYKPFYYLEVYYYNFNSFKVLFFYYLFSYLLISLVINTILCRKCYFGNIIITFIDDLTF